MRLPRPLQRPLPTKIAHRTVRTHVFFTFTSLHLLEMLYEDIDLEPVSALATKISRAHDNPSPPPRMQPLLDAIPPAPTNQHQLSDSLVSKVSDPVTSDEPLLRTLAPVPSPASPDPVSHPDRILVASPLASSSADLIVFDDDHLPDVTKVAVRKHNSVHVTYRLD